MSLLINLGINILGIGGATYYPNVPQGTLELSVMLENSQGLLGPYPQGTLLGNLTITRPDGTLGGACDLHAGGRPGQTPKTGMKISGNQGGPILEGVYTVAFEFVTPVIADLKIEALP